MSGREDRFFTFKVDEWINELLVRFKFQLQMSASRLGHFIENYALTTHAQDLESLDVEQKRVFKSNLRADVAAVRIHRSKNPRDVSRRLANGHSLHFALSPLSDPHFSVLFSLCPSVVGHQLRYTVLG